MVVAKAMVLSFWAALLVGSGWMAVRDLGGAHLRSLERPAVASSPVESVWLDLKRYRDLAASMAATLGTARLQAGGHPPECPSLLASGQPVLPLGEDERPYFSLSRYAQYPAEDQLLLQRADVENGRCRGGFGNDPETFRACNRRQCVMLELEDRGWCWGGGTISAEHRWLRCSEIPDDPPLTSELPFPEAEIRAMFPPGATRLDVAFSNLEGYFFGDVGDALSPVNPMTRLRREVEARLAACEDEACRQQVETDMINRLRFGLGEAVHPVPDFPLRTGRLSIGGKPMARDVSVLPMGGDRILVNIAPTPTEFVASHCRGLVAEGQLGPGGIARLTTLDDLRIRFTLHVLSPTQIELRPMLGEGERQPRLCGLDGTIFLRYEAEPPHP